MRIQALFLIPTAYFLLCFWNYALSVDLLPQNFGVLDSPAFFGYWLLHSHANDFHGTLLGELGSLSLLLTAVFAGAVFSYPDGSNWYEPIASGVVRGFKAFVAVLAAMILAWTSVVGLFLSSMFDAPFANWTVGTPLQDVTNATMLILSEGLLTLLAVHQSMSVLARRQAKTAEPRAPD